MQSYIYSNPMQKKKGRIKQEKERAKEVDNKGGKRGRTCMNLPTISSMLQISHCHATHPACRISVRF